MRAVSRACAAIVPTVLLASGCGLLDSAEREVEEAASSGIERAIGDRVQRELERAGVELQGKVDCDSNVDLKSLADGVDGTVSCNGKTRGGDPVKATFDGTLTADGTCRGNVVVTVGGEEKLRTPDTNVCAQQ